MENKPKKQTKTGHNIDPKELENLGRLKLTNQQIAERLGMCERSFYIHLKKHPELAQIIRISKRKTDEFVIGKLMKLINDGNVAATIFYLKVKAGWREKK